jgi:hypothetical protein
MSKDDKAILNMISSYLGRAIDVVDDLSPDGSHELAIVISNNELPTISELQVLVTSLKKLAK